MTQKKVRDGETGKAAGKPATTGGRDAKRPKKDRPSRSFFDHVINIICLLVLLGFIANEYKHLYRNEAPMGEYTTAYEKRYIVNATPPFIHAYYFLAPDAVEPGKTYPLVVALRGVSDYVYAGHFLAQPSFRRQFPAYIIAPVTSVRSVWAAPENRQYRMATRSFRYPDTLPVVHRIIEKTAAQYPVDASRLYITGHSMGGSGVYGALARYPDYFAAALALSGVWDPADAPLMTHTPLWAFHGGRDRQIPAQPAEALLYNIQRAGGQAAYTALPDEGHDIWRIVYPSPSAWEWLFGRVR